MARGTGIVALALVVALCGCGVETIEGEIADQQLCVAAQPVTEAVAGRTGDADPPDARELAGRAADPELRDALLALGEAYARAEGDPPGSAAWADADRAVEALDRVCQRLSAF